MPAKADHQRRRPDHLQGRGAGHRRQRAAPGPGAGGDHADRRRPDPQRQPDRAFCSRCPGRAARSPPPAKLTIEYGVPADPWSGPLTGAEAADLQNGQLVLAAANGYAGPTTIAAPKPFPERRHRKPGVGHRCHRRRPALLRHRPAGGQPAGLGIRGPARQRRQPGHRQWRWPDLLRRAERSRRSRPARAPSPWTLPGRRPTRVADPDRVRGDADHQFARGRQPRPRQRAAPARRHPRPAWRQPDGRDAPGRRQGHQFRQQRGGDAHHHQWQRWRRLQRHHQ